STLATVTGEAPILEAAWSLPVTVASPTTLGAAAGAGGIGLRLDRGLEAQWAGRDTVAACGPSTLLVEPGVVALAGPSARARERPPRTPLWQPSQPRNPRGGTTPPFPAPLSLP